MSAIFGHMDLFYSKLNEKARDEMFEDVLLRIFRGKVVRVYQSLGIPQAYYSKIRSSLLDMGCMTILQQGARGTETVIVLHHAPDRDEFTVIEDEDLTRRIDLVTLAQRVQDLTDQLGGVNIIEALAELQTQLRAVKREVDALGTKPPQARRRHDR